MHLIYTLKHIMHTDAYTIAYMKARPHPHTQKHTQTHTLAHKQTNTEAEKMMAKYLPWASVTTYVFR